MSTGPIPPAPPAAALLRPLSFAELQSRPTELNMLRASGQLAGAQPQPQPQLQAATPTAPPANTTFVPTAATASAPPPAVGATAQQQRVLELVNDVRAKHGLPALRLDPSLQATAQRHSGRMASERRLYHSDLPGQARGENVAEGYQSAEQVVEGWMNSPGHRRNILGDYRTIGIGQHGEFWTQQFGK